MLLTILRKYSPTATEGRLLVNGGFFCHTLELPKFRCIPEGEYSIQLTYSPRFRRIMPQIMNVPSRSGIRIHAGNFVKDTQGCPLVAYEKGKDINGNPAIFRSRDAFNDLFKVLEDAAKGQVLAIEIKQDAEA